MVLNMKYALILIFILSLNLQGQISFKKQIVPILKQYCYDCHGEKKKKGKLSLHTPNAIRNGSENGAVVIAGHPEKSKLYTLTTLPKGDNDVMPSKGELLKKSEMELLKQWIAEGADMEDGIKTAKQDNSGKNYVPPEFSVDKLANTLAYVDLDILNKLRAKNVFIRDVSTNGRLIELNYQHSDLITNPKLNLIDKIAANIGSINLTKASLNDQDVKVISKMKNLQKLNLSSSNITDAQLIHLAKLTELETINLYNTSISDAGLKYLQSLKKLRKLYLYQSKVSPENAKKLKASMPNLTINLGL